MARVLPLLIISDAVSGPTGLGRIARDLAVRVDSNLRDICRVATLGCGGPGSRKFNFQQYAIEGMGDNFVIPNLPEVWDDWAGKEPGIILFIWDASRLGWFSRPEIMCENPVIKQFLGTARFKRWIYAPIDAEGPNRKLTYPLSQALAGFDRVLAYSAWGEEIIRATLGPSVSTEIDLTSIPHGIDTSIFYPRNHADCRANFFHITKANYIRGTVTAIWGDEPLVGTVATNQGRKDWGLWAESCALFLRRHPKARFWIHTDVLERYWSIPALLIDFGLMDKTVLSLGYLEDELMAKAYSACDLTLGIGSGEGFGFPIFESLFCGTPCIHGNYGGAPEHMSKQLLVNPAVLEDGTSAHRYEGIFCCKRPVFDAQHWADKMANLVNLEQLEKSLIAQSVTSQLGWSAVWPRFEVWFRKGLA